MSNYIMQVDFFGNTVRAETDGLMVSLTDLARAGNKYRAENGMSLKPLVNIVQSAAYADFLKEAKIELGEGLVKVVGKGKQARTMGHVIVAIYVAEQFSPRFHFKVIQTFIDGKLLEFRDLGGTEFKALNVAIDSYLPGRELKASNKGVFITIAKHLRAKLLGVDAVAEDWTTATVAQTHRRYELEKYLAESLRLGLVRDYDHLKELIEKL